MTFKEQVMQLLDEDYTGCEIAEMLNVDVDLIYDIMDELEEIDCDTDDGYALASAGFGTDEDYGGCNDDY